MRRGISTSRSGLSESYNSKALFRGWALKISPDGKTTPICSGLRSPLGVGANEQRRDVLRGESGAVEWLVFAEASAARRLHGASHQLQLVSLRAGDGRGAGDAEFAVAHGNGAQAREGTRALRGGVSLQENGALDFRLRGVPRGRKVRAVRQPDFRRRLHAEHRDARDDGAGERRVAGRVLSLPRRTRHRPARAAFHAGRQAHHRRHEPRLARARHEGQPAPAPRLDRAHAVRDSRHPRAARRLHRCASRAPPTPRRPRARRATRWRPTRTSTSKATAARKWTTRARPSPPPKSRPTR